MRWGGLYRLDPVSRVFGFDRGKPIDRYYIEHFLKANVDKIRGRVLEVGDSRYTNTLGGDRVSRSDVLHARPGNAAATLIGDLTTGEGMPLETFDCFILTQTLPYIFDVRAAVKNCSAVLRTGGALLATFPGISQISRYDMDRWGDYWRFTSLSARKLFEEVFPARNVCIKTYGNVLAGIAFLHGISSEEIMQSDLDYIDLDYQLLIAVCAIKD